MKEYKNRNKLYKRMLYEHKGIGLNERIWEEKETAQLKAINQIKKYNIYYEASLLQHPNAVLSIKIYKQNYISSRLTTIDTDEKSPQK